MTRQSSAKRSYQRRPWLVQAARDLGVSYGHLRQCVVGVRKSRKTLSKLRTWKKAQRTAKMAELFAPAAAAEVARAATFIATNTTKS